jgi:uncharacterized repeat protein (TIGR01451 family)
MRTIIRATAFFIGILLITVALTPAGQGPVRAAPMAEITGTPTEPAPPTAVPTNTTVPPGQPTNTPVPGQPTTTPEPPFRPTTTPPDDRDDGDPPEVEISKSVDQREAKVGDLIGFTIRVTNSGGEAARDVVVSDTLPDYFDLLDATTSRGSVAVNGRTITVNIGALDPDEMITIRIRAYVNVSAPMEGSNTGTVTTSSSGDDPGNNISTVTITIQTPPATPTLPPATLTPPTPTSPPVAVVSPRPAAPPARLPPTGDGPASASWLLVMIGLCSIVISVLIGRKGTGNRE